MGYKFHTCLFYTDIFPYNALTRYPFSDDPETIIYFRELATKLKDRGLFPESTSRIMDLHINKRNLTFAHLQECLCHLAAFVNQHPDITGAFGITYLASVARRYGFEIIGEPPSTLRFYSAVSYYGNPNINESVLLQMKRGLQSPVRLMSRVSGFYDSTRVVLIERDELLRRHSNPEFQEQIILRP